MNPAASLSIEKTASPGRYSRNVAAALAALLVALVMMAASPTSADERGSLAALRQVSLSVEVAHPLRTTRAGDLTVHLARVLRTANPPLTVHDGLADRIRLTISVRPMSATELRGFWLPFSGIYGIGTVRLGVERSVDVPGEPHPLPVVVWRTERIVGSAWQVTDRQVLRLVDEMVAELLEARHRRTGE
jgi:hypothetical protein